MASAPAFIIEGEANTPCGSHICPVGWHALNSAALNNETHHAHANVRPIPTPNRMPKNIHSSLWTHTASTSLEYIFFVSTSAAPVHRPVANQVAYIERVHTQHTHSPASVARTRGAGSQESRVCVSE